MRLTKSSCFSEQFHSFVFQKHRTAVSRTFHCTQLLTLNPKPLLQMPKSAQIQEPIQSFWPPMAAPSRLPLGATASKIPSSQIRRRFSTHRENCSAKFNGLWPPLSSSILFCAAKGQHVPKREPNQRLSRLTHFLDGLLAQIRHTSVLSH